MNRKDALALLEAAKEGSDAIILSEDALEFVEVGDIPEGVEIEVGEEKENISFPGFEGGFFVRNNTLFATCRNMWPHKFWDRALGILLYFELLRKSVEARSRVRGDVKFIELMNEDAWIELRYEVGPLPGRTSDALKYVRALMADLERDAEDATLRAGEIAAEIGRRIGQQDGNILAKMVQDVEGAANNKEKGDSLEKLTDSLFGTIPGFVVSGRNVQTETEEIDLVILNGSDHPRFRHEGSDVLVECKNWSGKCGKNEFVLFEKKILNRKGRCILGFLISWNGFSETITKEMLRSSHEKTLIVPLDGAAIRRAAEQGDFMTTLSKALDYALSV